MKEPMPIIAKRFLVFFIFLSPFLGISWVDETHRTPPLSGECKGQKEVIDYFDSAVTVTVMKRLSQVFWAALWAALLAVAVSACAASAPPQPRALAAIGVTFPKGVKISPAQAKQLAQPTISYDDYKAAFRRYSACLAAKGYTLMGNGESNKVILFGVPDTAVQSGADDYCFSYEFDWVDTIWQFSRVDTSNAAKAYAVCLTKAGVKPKSTEKEKLEQLERAHIDPGDCYRSQYPHGEY